jgi:hypothetical protein
MSAEIEGACPFVFDVLLLLSAETRSPPRPALEVFERDACLWRHIDVWPSSSSAAAAAAVAPPVEAASTAVMGLSLVPPFAGPSQSEFIESSGFVAVALSNGVVNFYDCHHARLQRDLQSWRKMFPADRRDNWGKMTGGGAVPTRGADQAGSPRTGLGAPKHGKEDPKNEIHIGGNTWAGGTGGSDTAGLGGRGGPYRLDKGHAVHQVSDEAKAAVSAEAKRQAAEIAKNALSKRLEDISMGKDEYDIYKRFQGRVENQVSQLKAIVTEFKKRSKERVWLRNQTNGELDEGKIVDGVAGDKVRVAQEGQYTCAR